MVIARNIHIMEVEGSIKNGLSRDIGNIGHKTEDEDRQKTTTTQKIKKMSNTDTTRKSEVNPGPRLFLGRGMNFLLLIACTAVLFQWFGKSFIGDGGKKKQSS
jgi:hypothetical protein